MDKNKVSLINNINSIIIDYYNYSDINNFYNNLCKIDNDISLYISETLYKEYKTEHQSIYYELIYDGDEDDADIIVRDCIIILERIVNIIIV
jgi:hypothetical protein